MPSELRGESGGSEVPFLPARHGRSSKLSADAAHSAAESIYVGVIKGDDPAFWAGSAFHSSPLRRRLPGSCEEI
jgi:hypothetical protein